jgi:hypothetical protein
MEFGGISFSYTDADGVPAARAFGTTLLRCAMYILVLTLTVFETRVLRIIFVCKWMEFHQAGDNCIIQSLVFCTVKLM